LIKNFFIVQVEFFYHTKKIEEYIEILPNLDDIKDLNEEIVDDIFEQSKHSNWLQRYIAINLLANAVNKKADFVSELMTIDLIANPNFAIFDDIDDDCEKEIAACLVIIALKRQDLDVRTK
jgi:hypothetical protein